MSNPNTPEELDRIFREMIDTYDCPARIEWARQIAALIPKPYGKILDIGCGTGLILSFLPDGNTGIDFSIEALKVARKRCPNNILLHRTFPPLPFDDCSFQIALCTEVLEHVDIPSIILSEAYRILAPGGTLVVTVPDCSKGIDEYYLHVNSFTQDTLLSLLQESSFILSYLKIDQDIIAIATKPLSISCSSPLKRNNP
jgi:ubiquinone/menaquinone biosynthesis C-methylase UbiE